MTNPAEMKWPKLPSYLVTAIVVVLSTLASNYVSQQLNTHINERQTELIENLDERLRLIEMDRFTQGDFDRNFEGLERRVDRIQARVDRLESSN